MTRHSKSGDMASMSRGYYTVYGRMMPVTTVLFLACGWAILVAPDGNLTPYAGDPRALLLPAIAWAFFTWRALTSGAFVLPGRKVRLRRLFSTVLVDADDVANCEVGAPDRNTFESAMMQAPGARTTAIRIRVGYLSFARYAAEGYDALRTN